MRIFTLVLLIALTACTGQKDMIGTLPQLTFAQLQPLPIDAERVEISTAVPDQEGTNPIAHTTIAKSFETYAKQRFVGMGGPGAGTLSITVNETRISRGTENTDNKFTAWTQLDKSDDYKAAIKVTFRYDSADRSVFKNAVLQQERGLTIPQRTSLAERQKMEQQLIENLIADFDKQAVPAMQNQLNILAAGAR